MPLLDDLVRAIEREYGVARAQSSRAALLVLQRSYEEGWTFAGDELRDVLGERLQPGDLRQRPDPRRVRFISRYAFSALTGVEGLAREKVRAVMKRATEDATLDVRDVERLLAAELNEQVDGFRIPVIARTEVNRAGNAAKLDRYMKSPSVDEIQVSTSEDGRVRAGPNGTPSSPADHRLLEGQVRRKGEPFRVVRVRGGPNDNGDRYPPFDPNCRCTVAPYFRTEKLAARSHDRWHGAMSAYERTMTAAMRSPWLDAFVRVDQLIRVRLPNALLEARRS